MVLSPLGSGKTYRLANNLTIDYQDFDELETLWTNQVVSDKEVMQIIAASAETMELHAQTPFVMNAVSASQTARDAIGTDGVGYDAVAAVAMAIGKYAAGIAGLDPTAYADIDAVASDANAMDAVSASLLAYNAVFKSDYSVSSLWASTPGAKTILQNSGNKSLPFNTSTPGGDANITVDDGSSSGLPGSTAHQLYFDINLI